MGEVGVACCAEEIREVGGFGELEQEEELEKQ